MCTSQSLSHVMLHNKASVVRASRMVVLWPMPLVPSRKQNESMPKLKKNCLLWCLPVSNCMITYTAQHVSSSRQEELRVHTMEDTTLQTLTNIIRHGWPERLSSVPASVKQFFPFRDELSVEDGIIMKGTTMVIPQKLHKEYLMLLHKGHPGAEATKQRARNVVFWTTMTKYIDGLVQSCSICNALRQHQSQNFPG